MLALSIALGLLVVVLYYYQQAAMLRDSTLKATAGLAAVRLCLDRLGTELRTASGQPGAFRGGPREIEFLQCDLPEPAVGPASEGGSGVASPFLLRRIRYALPSSEESGAGLGLVRTETLLASVNSTPPRPTVEDEPMEPLDTNDLWAVESTTQVEEGVRITAAFPSPGAAALSIPELRYLGLRYWDGAIWQDSWSGLSLPRGVEITLALEALPPEADPEALPGEVFRRVIAIPAGLATAPVAAANGGAEEGSPDGWGGWEAQP